jgi:hypothetical protein
MGGVFALLLIADAARGRLTWDKTELAIKIVRLIGAGMGLFLYGIGFALTTTVNEKGLGGQVGGVADRFVGTILAQCDESLLKVSPIC